MAYGPGREGGPGGLVPPGAGGSGGSLPQASTAYPVDPSWLAATADRERTVGVLRAGFAEGRLTQDELDERVAQAYASRTYGELWALVADLPAGPLPVSPYPPGRAVMPPGSAPARTWGSAVALIITALVIFTLAALVTAIITAHAQPGYPGFQVVRPLPAIQPLPDQVILPAPHAHQFAPRGSGL